MFAVGEVAAVMQVAMDIGRELGLTGEDVVAVGLLTPVWMWIGQTVGKNWRPWEI